MHTPVLRRGLTLLGITYFALWACGPIAVAPPPVPMAEGRTQEIGLAPSFGAAVPCAVDFVCSGPSLAGWYRTRVGKSDLGAFVFAGTPSLVGAGFLFRYRLVEQDRLVAALQLDGGFLYGALGVPIAFSVADHTWIYVTPQVRAQLWSPARIGTGLRWTSPGGLALGVEGGVGWSGSAAVLLDGTLSLGAQF